MRLDDLCETKLRNYAILAHDVLRSYDLAHLVLAALDKKTEGDRAVRYLQRLVEKLSPCECRIVHNLKFTQDLQ